MYSHERWEALLKATEAEIRKLATLKGGEYAGDCDRLANFRRNAERLGTSMELVWAVYAGKHWDAIQQYVQDLGAGKDRPRLEGLAGRADDLIVYAILFKAILEEREAVRPVAPPDVSVEIVEAAVRRMPKRPEGERLVPRYERDTPNPSRRKGR